MHYLNWFAYCYLSVSLFNKGNTDKDGYTGNATTVMYSGHLAEANLLHEKKACVFMCCT